MVLMFLICLFMIIAIPTTIFCCAMKFYYSRKEKKFTEKHPEYTEFMKKYMKLQHEASCIWNGMPNYRREVEHCIEEMKYYPEYSETYQYLKNKLNVARRKIEECKTKSDQKNVEIHQFVRANKTAIETIKDDDLNSYNNWVARFNLDKE